MGLLGSKPPLLFNVHTTMSILNRVWLSIPIARRWSTITLGWVRSRHTTVAVLMVGGWSTVPVLLLLREGRRSTIAGVGVTLGLTLGLTLVLRWRCLSTFLGQFLLIGGGSSQLLRLVLFVRPTNLQLLNLTPLKNHGGDHIRTRRNRTS